MSTYSAQPHRKVRQLARLEELAEIGMDIARGLRLNPGRDVALAFDRVSRAIRYTIALDARLCEQADPWDFDLSRIGRAKPARAAPVHDDVAEAEDREEAEIMFEAERRMNLLHERLCDPDEMAMIREKPLAEVVQHICKTLGVPFDPETWDTKDLGINEKAGMSG